MTETYLTTRQIAQRLHVVEETVARYWIARGTGRLRATKAGRRWLVLESDLQEFIREGLPTPAEGE